MMGKLVELLANQLEAQFGQCLLPRPEFLAWLDEQLDRCAQLSIPGSLSKKMIETGYVEWRAEQLGIDLDWENAPAAGDEFPNREQPDDQEREPLE